MSITRECEICGAEFVPINNYRRMCPECRNAIHHNKGRKLPRSYKNPTDVIKYENELRERNYENYRDHIVAEGYASRQIAKTLESVGRIKTEL